MMDGIRAPRLYYAQNIPMHYSTQMFGVVSNQRSQYLAAYETLNKHLHTVLRPRTKGPASHRLSLSDPSINGLSRRLWMAVACQETVSNQPRS